ncbi:MAG: hypothetical protein K9W45_11550 [Candidatus Heimdallarchaeum aukensis]|uniref:Uncharacterized protein n=1 Tax=Candidatus Heimdallarchaeum aukensis TaxID=2876573 RepID=A0A9Y1BLH9_9ARCH|nr:MAG: hypothetical protein K9W45_11550 [Candidatus Heimdallarchaeum aukensis]
MGIKRKIKYAIAKKLIEQRRKKLDFDISQVETYQLPINAKEHDNNSFYFTGHANDGHRFLARLAFRGVGNVEVWFALFIPNRGLYNYKKNIDKPNNKGKNIFSSGPLTFTCIEPAKKWKIDFEGELEGENEQISVKFGGVFSSDYPVINFSTDIHPAPMARSLSQETWSKSFFAKLKESDQVHTEQCGKFVGSYSLSGETVHLSMSSLRDHSYGKRDWSFMERHIWIIIGLDDGSFFNFSLVDYPILKNLVTGFHIKKDGIIRVIDGSTFGDIWCDRETIPKEFTFFAQMESEERILVNCSFDLSLTWIMDNVYSITEGLANFELLGMKGKGIAEFGKLTKNSEK